MKQRRKKNPTLIVGTDLTPGAGHAVERAIRLPLAPETEVVLLHVLPEGMPRALRVQVEDSAQIKLRQLAAAAGRSAQAAGNAGITITPKLAYGEAYLELIRAARTSAAELIVMGRHGSGGIRSLLIGSTAMRVIRKGDTPVLIVSKEPESAYRRPLIAVGLEDAARAVLDLALRIIDPAVSAVPVVHAYWPPFEPSVLAKLSPKDLAEYHRGFEKKAEAGLKKILASLPDKGARCRPVVVRGDPRSVVLEEATQRKCDLIAVGTHARSGVSHVLLGSVAEWLISKAPCDVLVARPAHVSFRLP